MIFAKMQNNLVDIPKVSTLSPDTKCIFIGCFLGLEIEGRSRKNARGARIRYKKHRFFILYMAPLHAQLHESRSVYSFVFFKSHFGYVFFLSWGLSGT